MMDHEIEQMLGRMTPRGVHAELRPRVLEAVAGQLASESGSPWLRRSALAVAALLLLGIAMNFWASNEAERRLARIYGPPPVSKQAMQLAHDVEKTTDPQTAQWVYRQFTAAHSSDDGLTAYGDMLKRLLDTSHSLSSEFYNETNQKDHSMDRDHSRRTSGDRSGCQRGVRLDYRYTA